MAIVTIPDENRTLKEVTEIKHYLSGIGIDYERWEATHSVDADASTDEILAAYSDEIEKLKAQGGYVTADVIDITPQTAGLEAMLAKFSHEHWHEEDEVRFIIRGRGLFHIRPQEGAVTAIEVEAGDLIRVPRGTRHWFNLCTEHNIRAIRLFQDMAGWTPYYTESGEDAKYQPLCFGLSYVAPQVIGK